MFEQAKWIWNNKEQKSDQYVEFRTDFQCEENALVLLRISVASNYAVYVNGCFVNSGQYGDFPHYKVYDELDISQYIVNGTNKMAIIAWYCGVSTFTRPKENPGLLFELEQNGEIIDYSGEHTKCRLSKRYVSGRNELITWQLGLSFAVDLRQDEEWMTDSDLSDFGASVCVDNMPENLYLRPVKKLLIEPRVTTDIVSGGVFQYTVQGTTAGTKMQYAALSFRRPSIMEGIEKGKEDDGVYYVLDMLSEVSGYLDIDIEVPEDCDMEIGWGEHLEDGRCRTEIEYRNFSANIYLKKGRNQYMNPFRRFGCRYIQLFIHADRVKVHYAGIRPTVYPLQKKKYQSGNLLRDRIYEVSQHTLIQCMHEHYEDCPWREQALYTLDSRNQMLCGYYAFSEYEFPRACLRLIAKSAREDGMLPICHPADTQMCIPSFTLFYIVQLAEYYLYSQDEDLIKECFPCVKRISETFVKQIDETGLIMNLNEEEEFWNFYEWQPYLDGHTYEGPTHDMCLNALFSWVLDYYMKLCEVVGKDTQDYEVLKKQLNSKIKEVFYDEQSKLFRINDGVQVQPYSVLANAWGMLCGAAESADYSAIVELIKANGPVNESEKVIPATLSMNTFRYEALLKQEQEGTRTFILDEIDEMYLRMLQKGATTFWETGKGDRDFDFAGSLCHGWSAMPIYYYEILEKE